MSIIDIFNILHHLYIQQMAQYTLYKIHKHSRKFSLSNLFNFLRQVFKYFALSFFILNFDDPFKIC